MRRTLWILIFNFGLVWAKSGGGVGGFGSFGSPPPLAAPSVGGGGFFGFGVPFFFGGMMGGGFGGLGLLFLLILLFIAFSIVRGLQRASQGGGLGPGAEVARLRLALLYRPEVQTELRSLAERADTQSPEGLAELVGNAVALLLREQPSWRFASFERARGDFTEVEAQFQRWMTEDRGSYTETFHRFGDEREIRPTAPQVDPAGRYLLVSLIVALRGNFPPVTTPLRGSGAREALLALTSATRENLLAAFVSWTPEAQGEALTEDELVSGWPQLDLL